MTAVDSSCKPKNHPPREVTVVTGRLGNGGTAAEAPRSAPPPPVIDPVPLTTPRPCLSHSCCMPSCQEMSSGGGCCCCCCCCWDSAEPLPAADAVPARNPYCESGGTNSAWWNPSPLEARTLESVGRRIPGSRSLTSGWGPCIQMNDRLQPVGRSRRVC
jgi:hypothetical protein